MIELARITLNNEMDLILAHRGAMKLAELSGLSLSAQTTFATAVSEVSRSTIDHGQNGYLSLGIVNPPREQKYIVAAVVDDHTTINSGYAYAKKLVHRSTEEHTNTQSILELHYFIPRNIRITDALTREWKKLFEEEKPVSPYEEIKRKNEQLQQLSQKLQASEEQYKTLTNSLPLIIFSIDEIGGIIYANEWLPIFTGRNIHQLNRDKWEDVIHPDDYESFSSLLYAGIRNIESTINIQCRLRNYKSGEFIWHLVSISPLIDANGNLLHHIGFMVDINAQKKFEETLRDNRALKEIQQRLTENEEQLRMNIRELNRSNRDLEQFAYIASHDLQEPLRKIIIYSDYLVQKNQGKMEQKSEEYLDNMRKATHRMRNLVTDLLAFSQVNHLKKASLSRADLNVILKDALQDLDLYITENGAMVQYEGLPTVNGDPSLLRQVFENLVSNSIKYGRKDIPVKINITAESTPEGTNIYFTDNGIGFDEKYLEKIFHLFQRLHSNTKFEGTGLGLAICRKIMEMHGGTISATSTPGSGATFILHFPLGGII